MKKMKIQLEDHDIPLKEVLNVHNEILVIADDNSIFSLTKRPHDDSAGQWVELCPDDYSSDEYWLYTVPSWGIFGYQTHLRVLDTVIYFYLIHNALEGKDALLAATADKLIDYILQEPDNLCGTSWETHGSDNRWELSVVRKFIKDSKPS